MAVLILVVAITPLEAILRPGHFELSVPALSIGGRSFDVSLDDQSGLVGGLALAGADRGLTASTRTLIVTWQGDSCGAVVTMQFSTSGDRYRLAQQTTSQRCMVGTIFGRTFALLLRAPIDPSHVDVVHDGSSLDDKPLARRGTPRRRDWIAWARKPGHDSYWQLPPRRLPEPPSGARRDVSSTWAAVRVGCPRDLKSWGYQVAGVDASPTLIAAAREADPGGDYRVADAAELPFADDTFALVTAFMSLQDVDRFRTRDQ